VVELYKLSQPRLFWNAKQLVVARVANIGVNDEHAPIVRSEHRCERQRARRFAVSMTGRRHQHDLPVLTRQRAV
jgi:hypothetical protein